MRQERIIEPSIFGIFATHEISRELKHSRGKERKVTLYRELIAATHARRRLRAPLCASLSAPRPASKTGARKSGITCP